MALDADRVRVLVEVARAGSIAEAARRMAFTPSALSQQLAKLEAELGCRLVDRGAGGVTLTPAGAVLAEHGETVMGELRAAEAAVSAFVAAQPPHLALGTFATAGAVMVPAALAALRREHPGVQLSLVDLEPPAGYGLVASGDLDVLITHRYPGMVPTPVRGLVRRTLLTDPLRLVMPAHDAAPSSRVTVADLAGRTWVSGGPGVPNRVCLEQLAAEAGFSPEVSYETADYALILALVRAGLGVALVPASVLGHFPSPGIAVRELGGVEPAREICVVHRRRPTALARDLIGRIGEAATTLAAG